MKKQDKIFYTTVLRLLLDDYKERGMTLEEAYDLYDRWNIFITYKNGKIEFEVEE